MTNGLKLAMSQTHTNMHKNSYNHFLILYKQKNVIDSESAYSEDSVSLYKFKIGRLQLRL